ncbi:ABC transporter permease [Solibacillus sp. R5-41]|uniref:ABC transporter permease n=1 Tax=Solibacillus sp. R5-41 TaxID=2048654 RepID=UPI000C1280BE|nr:ABC transporter permease [Solibacillus sp. R5-41]ATP39155.1 ABC transporter permease [Solibacillus sp. R5-41]
MSGYFKFELKQFFTNKKNLAIYFLLAFAAFFYAIKVAPAYDPIEKVDREEIEARYLTRQEFIYSVMRSNFDFIHPVTKEYYYTYLKFNPLDKTRLTALDAGDLQEYARVTSDWYFTTNYMTYYNEHLSYNPRYYVKDRELAHALGFYHSLEQFVRYKAYAKADYALSINQFEQRTALQTVERLLIGPLPIILIICALLLAIDIVTKDCRHPSILKGFPIADWKKLLVKMLVAFIGSLALFIPLGVGFIMIGMQSGFGHFQLPSPVFTTTLQWQKEGSFDMMTLGAFLAQSFALLFMWFIVIIAVVLLCSVIFRQEMVNLAVAILIIFGEKFYLSRGVGYFWNVELYPTSYIQVGKIVSKYQNFYLGSESLDYRLGIQLLALGAGIVLILTLLISFNKRFKLVK